MSVGTTVPGAVLINLDAHNAMEHAPILAMAVDTRDMSKTLVGKVEIGAGCVRLYLTFS